MTRDRRSPAGADLDRAAWAAAAAVVQHLDRPDLPQRLLDLLAGLAPFEMAAMFVYRAGSSPIHVHDTFPTAADKVGLLNYSDSTYVLNPFYAAFLRGLPTGAYRMRDLAPDAYAESRVEAFHKAQASSSEEIGYLTQGWPPGMEELCLAVALPEGECAEISLSRRSAAGGFSDADVSRLGAVVPLVAAAFAHYWQAARNRHLANSRDSGAGAAFAAFGGTLLSPREREVAQLLLRGHSGVSVGAQLGISATTVKTHRKNLYAKLGIASHYELYSLFLQSLQRSG